MQNFIFGAEGLPQTPQELARMRQIAAALQKRRAPQNVGEGLQALGDGAVAGVMNYRANKGQREGTAGANNAFQSIFGALSGNGAEAGPVPGGDVTPSVSGYVPSSATADPISQRIDQGFAAFGQGAATPNYADAIASIESAGSGDYLAVGPETGKGKAYGRYQVMDFNVGPWTEKHYGKRLTPDEFLKDPKAQDAVFNGEFGSYVNKYGNPQDAASMWFTGRPLAKGANAADVNGMTGSRYVDKFTAALGPNAASQPVQTAQAMPQGGQPPVMADVTSGQSPRDALRQALAARQSPQAGQSAITQALAPQSQPAPPAASPVPVSSRQQVAQAMPQGQIDINKAIEVMNNPFLSEGKRAVLQTMIERQLQAQDPLRQMQLERARLELDRLRSPQVPDSVRALDERAKRAGLQPGTPEYNEFYASGGSKGVTVNNNIGEGDKFYENLDKKNAETFSMLSEGGVTARSKLNQIDRLESLLAASPSGMEAGVKQMLGDFGINTEGLDNIQSTRALLEAMVPQQRPVGSGPMSDADVKMFRNSLPRLINQPGGNKLILDTMRGIAQYEMQMGEIADAVADRTIKPAEGRKRIRELQNPISSFRQTMRGGEKPAGNERTQIDPSNALNAGRAAIEAGAPREAVIKRLKEAGIDPSGL